MKQGIKEKDIRDFEKYANKLNDVICRIREYNPNANVYLAMENLCLMSGFAHDDYGRKHQENIVTCVAITSADGGDW